MTTKRGTNKKVSVQVTDTCRRSWHKEVGIERYTVVGKNGSYVVLEQNGVNHIYVVS
jgi:hypothetical protein